MAEIDRTLIGQLSEPYVVDVEKGAIRKFADAIGDPNPLYRDAAFARRHGYDDIVAPPTFPTCFRPPNDLPWLASLDRRRIVAGETSFACEHPVVAGMQLVCRWRLTGVDEKRGGRGTMELLHQQLEAHDASGRLILTGARTTVYRSAEQLERASLS